VKNFIAYIVAAILFTAAPALGQIIPRGGGGGGGGGGGDASAANQATQITALPLEDAPHTTGDRGSFSLGVIHTGLGNVGAIGDYSQFSTDLAGRQYNIPMITANTAIANQLGKQEGVLHADGDAGVPALVIRNSATTPTAITGLDLRYSLIGVTSLTQVLTTQHHSTAYLTSIQVSKLEDTAHATGDAGIPTWGVENEDQTGFGAGGGSTFDYTPIATTRAGEPMVVAMHNDIFSDNNQISKREDISHTTLDAGVMALGVANADLATTFGSNGDYTPVATTVRGEIWPVHSGANFFAITDTAIAAVSQNFAFGFTSRKVFISAPVTNGDGVCIDHGGGTAICPASDTAGDDVLEPGESISIDEHAITSISAISASGTNTIVVRAFN